MKLTKPQFKFMLKLNRGPTTPEGKEWIVSRTLTAKGFVRKQELSSLRELTPLGRTVLRESIETQL